MTPHPLSAHPLVALAEGRPEGFAAVLQNCRMEGFAGSAYGGEDIRALVQRQQFRLSDCVSVITPDLAFVMGADADGAPAALVADMHEDWIVRLWILGASTLAQTPVDRVCTPCDLDLDQRGGQVAFAASDHPGLAAEHGAAVLALGRRWLLSPPPAVTGRLGRARPLVLRAASQGPRAAALFRLQGAGDHGLSGFFAAALFDGDAEPSVVVDAAGRDAALAAPWTPVLRPSPA